MKLLILGNPDSPGNIRITEEATARGHEARVIHMESISLRVDHEGECVVIENMDLSPGDYDIALFRDMHPQYISAYLSLAQALERLQISVANPALIDVPFVWNKIHQMMKLSSAQLPVPKTLFITHDSSIDTIPDTFQFPVIVKPIHGSHGTDIRLCDTIDDVRRAVATAASGTYIAQQYLDAPHDYRVFVVNGEALGAVKKQPPDNEFRSNTDLGATFISFDMTDNMRDIAVSAASALYIPIAGVDMREDNGTMRILEVNRNPGFQHFEAATSINVAAAIVDYLESL